MNEYDRILLLKIKGETEFLLTWTKRDDLNSFLSDNDLQYIASMSLIKIGGYVKSLSDDLKQTYSDIRWVSITNLRNIAAHTYKALHMNWIWKNVTKDVPDLLEQVEEIFQSEGVEG